MLAAAVASSMLVRSCSAAALMESIRPLLPTIAAASDAAAPADASAATADTPPLLGETAAAEADAELQVREVAAAEKVEEAVKREDTPRHVPTDEAALPSLKALASDRARALLLASRAALCAAACKRERVNRSSACCSSLVTGRVELVVERADAHEAKLTRGCAAAAGLG